MIAKKFFSTLGNIREKIISELLERHKGVHHQYDFKRGNGYFKRLMLPYHFDFSWEPEFCASGLTRRYFDGRANDGELVYFNLKTGNEYDLDVVLKFKMLFPLVTIVMLVNDDFVLEWKGGFSVDNVFVARVPKHLFRDGELNICLKVSSRMRKNIGCRESEVLLRELKLIPIVS